jgi:hypothetical protein
MLRQHRSYFKSLYRFRAGDGLHPGAVAFWLSIGIKVSQ